MRGREILEAWADDYLAAAARRGWDEFARGQRGRLLSLAYGAGGLAWACWHAARVRDDQRLLAAAARWLRRALARQRCALAWHGTRGGPRAELAPGALLYGPAGLHLLGVRLAEARGDLRARARAAARLLDGARRTPEPAWDLYSGGAGTLLALAAVAGDSRTPVAEGRALAARLTTRLDPRLGRAGTAAAAGGGGLGHGTAGIFFALLAWAEATGEGPGEPFATRLDGFLAAALADPGAFCPRPSLRASLCNGFAGIALLAARGFEVLGGEAEFVAAREAARIALAAVPPRPDLCCGRTGVAYACLAVARIDPAGPWRRHAEELALSLLLCRREDWEVAGLLGGEAGLACLAVDLAAGRDGGVPGLDWTPWPVEGRLPGDRRRPAEAAHG